MYLTRERAKIKLHELLSNPNLIKHCLAVESAMLFYSKYFQIPEDQQIEWGVAGLLHDADWEKFPDQHPDIITKWLIEQNASVHIINAIQSHGFSFPTKPNCQMAHTLRAVDELTGLITAVALIKGRSLANVTVESILKKLPETKFASGVNRQDIIQGAQEINIPLEKHIANVLNAMQSISDTLEL